jgi:hypothetical protein
MDPIQQPIPFVSPSPGMQPSPALQPISSYMFAPGIFFSTDESNSFLSSLDSDTRDYVLKHTDDFRTRADIEECINRLHNG